MFNVVLKFKKIEKKIGEKTLVYIITGKGLLSVALEELDCDFIS